MRPTERLPGVGPVRQVRAPWSGVVAVVGALALVAACGSGSEPGVQTPAEAEPAQAEVAQAEGTAAEPAPLPSGTIVVSWVGDNILGTDKDFGGFTLPVAWAQAGNDPGFFFQNVREHFEADDLTVANFEVALTDSRTERYKGEGETYHFYGDPAVAQALPAGSVEVVTIANNHTFDYLQQGFDDTLAALDAVGVDYVGSGSAQEGSDYDHQVLREVQGIPVGLLSYQTWVDTPATRAKIEADIAGLRERGAAVVIPYFHWGIEAQYQPYEVQRDLARVAIDAGADAVIGTHPHVLQSMETYKGKLIAYSLGNFSFGGNSNPTDKRTMILQTQLTVQDGAVAGVDFRVIPTRLSRESGFNDYVPTPYTGAERDAALAFINEISPALDGQISTEFTPVS